ncbi:hypothetical protein [Nocardia sp. NPDC004711]
MIFDSHGNLYRNSVKTLEDPHVKKFVVAAVIAGGIAGPAATAAADFPTIYDPWTACIQSGQTYDQCQALVNNTQPTDQGAGFGWTGSAAGH